MATFIEITNKLTGNTRRTINMSLKQAKYELNFLSKAYGTKYTVVIVTDNTEDGN